MIKRYDNEMNQFLILKALNYFVENPYEEIYLREFGRKMSISPNTSQRFLNIFLKEGFITEIRRGNLRFFKANLDSVIFRQIKVVFSLKKIKDTGLIEQLGRNNVSHAILFGSVAKGRDDKKSDIDLVIIAVSKKKVVEVINNIQDRFDRELSTHIFSFDEWEKQAKENKSFYLDVITEGINMIGDKPVVGK